MKIEPCSESEHAQHVETGEAAQRRSNPSGQQDRTLSLRFSPGYLLSSLSLLLLEPALGLRR
ncbi:MAG: hypothetical protein JY451_03180 [Erythrobacter sp.]|nr:MAG: hypothetical protein JY451_03180 [Erythrobacter sp.]